MVPERDEEKRERFSAHIPPVFLESFMFMNSSNLKRVVIFEFRFLRFNFLFLCMSLSRNRLPPWGDMLVTLAYSVRTKGS